MLALALLAGLLRYDHWNEIGAWVARVICIIGAATGIAFMFARLWAQVIMAVLMIVAALFFLDMVLMFGFHGNRPWMYLMVVGVAIAFYTMVFLLVLAASPSDEQL